MAQLLGDDPPEPPHAASASTPIVTTPAANVGLTLAIAICPPRPRRIPSERLSALARENVIHVATDVRAAQGFRPQEIYKGSGDHRK